MDDGWFGVQTRVQGVGIGYGHRVFDLQEKKERA